MAVEEAPERSQNSRRQHPNAPALRNLPHEGEGGERGERMEGMEKAGWAALLPVF
jgi:hypothetical protein